MEESCAVCAEVVEWVAYGECGHLDVCAACIARLRFVCDDRRCCICKSLSPFVFVTKALGSLTRVINDFSDLPADAKDGKVGPYWFHEGIQAYFDDFDAYKIIKDMCRLSCIVCEKSDAEGKQTSKRKSKIKNIEQLKDHLSRRHELFFCSLCLANKKAFICEQKLYNHAHLRQHIRSGDSEVDAFESERCGFSGHPYCEFCQIPFYGDNELYFHMSTEHFTCHLGEREHATQFEYYADYNDLEIHFRQAHFLCEDDECLDKKFIVFESEADMKKHAALEHGGNMTLPKSNATLQLPTCFHFPVRAEDVYRTRTHTCGPGVASNQISSATSSDAEGTSPSFLHNASSSVHPIGHISSSDLTIPSTTVPSSGHQGTALNFRAVLLNGPSFPPLPTTTKGRRHKFKKTSQETSHNTVNLLHNRSSSHFSGSSNAVNCSHSDPEVLPQSKTLTVGNSTSSGSVNPLNHLNSASSGVTSGSIAKHVGSSSSPFDFVDGGSLDHSACGESSSKGDDVQAANKSLVDNIHAALKFDPDKCTAFKIISREYHGSEIKAGEYFSCVHQFGLEHLILDLARLCPDQQKELMEISKSWVEGSKETAFPRESGKKGGIKNTKKGKEKCEDSDTTKKNTSQGGLVNHMKELKAGPKPDKEISSSNGVDNKDKGKSKIPTIAETPKILPSESQTKDVVNTSAVTKLPTTLPSKLQSKMSEILLEYCQSKDVGCSNGGGSNCGQIKSAIGGKKKLKKSCKFLKNRVGESSTSVVPVLKLPNTPSDLKVVRPNEDSILASVRGVWRGNGGRRLVTLTEASPCSR